MRLFHVSSLRSLMVRALSRVERMIANDGWLYRMLEPHPASFSALQRTHRDRAGLRLDNAAIAKEDGMADLFVSNPNGRLAWHRQTYSLRAEQHAKAARLRNPQAVSPVRVVSKTLPSLFAPYGTTLLNVFLVDAEGSDGLIVRQLLRTPQRTQMIIYESVCLPEAEQRELLAALEQDGYEITSTPSGTIALRPDTGRVVGPGAAPTTGPPRPPSPEQSR